MIRTGIKKIYATLNHGQPTADRPGPVAAIDAAPGPDAVCRPELIGKYDRDIFNPLIRAYYGREAFYNVGLWSERCLDQADACTNLVDRILSRAAFSSGLVLDVGCGLGATTNQIQKKWPHSRVIGVNISKAQVAHAREIHPSLEFYPMDATRLAFPDAMFDTIVSIEAAFHFDTRADFFRESYRTLKPGGSLLLADILFKDGPMASAISVWDVCESNALPDLLSYQDALTKQGFVDVSLEDITRESWLAWCHSLGRWLEENHQHSAHSTEQVRNWHDSLPRLSRAVRHYFMVSARRPPAAN